MIKKIVITLVATTMPLAMFAATNHISNQKPSYTGLYAGVGTGFSNFANKTIFTFAPGIGGATIRNNSTRPSIIGNASVGYRFALNQNWRLGAKLALTLPSTSSSFDWVVPATPENAKISDKISAHYTVAALADVGYIVHNNLFSIVTGPEIVHYDLNTAISQGTVSIPEKHSYSGTGWLIGLNAEQLITSHFSLTEGLSYTYNSDFSFNMKDNSIVTNVKFSNMGSTAANIGLIYNF